MIDEKLPILIFDILLKHECENAQNWLKIFQYNDTLTDEELLKSINRFWKFQLLAVKEKLPVIADCLINDIEIEDWLHLFDVHIAPLIKLHKLPRILKI